MLVFGAGLNSQVRGVLSPEQNFEIMLIMLKTTSGKLA